MRAKSHRIKTENVPGCRSLNPQQITFVCNLFGQYKYPKEIQRLLKEIHGISVSPATLYGIRDANPEKIEELRNKYLAKIDDVPIAQDKVRLERIEHLYQYATTIRCKKDCVDTALKALSFAREEVKGSGAQGASRPGDMNFMQFNFNNMSDKDLIALERRLKKTIIDLEPAKQEAGKQ